VVAKRVQCWCAAFGLVFIYCRVQFEGNDDEGAMRCCMECQ